MDKESRKIYFQMAVIGYKHTFKKLMQLIKLKAKGVFLQIQYKVLEISYKRELRKSITQKREWKKIILKYIAIAAIGVGIFLILQSQLEKSRGYKAIGGEGFFLFLPLIWAFGASLQEGDGK